MLRYMSNCYIFFDTQKISYQQQILIFGQLKYSVYFHYLWWMSLRLCIGNTSEELHICKTELSFKARDKKFRKFINIIQDNVLLYKKYFEVAGIIQTGLFKCLLLLSYPLAYL